MVSDILLASNLRFIVNGSVLDPFPHLQTWLKKQYERSAFQRAYAANGETPQAIK